MTAVADTMPGSKRPAARSVADRVTAQLQRDYPPGALSWVSELSWSGPSQVPVAQIDHKAGDWSAADDKRKVASFARRINGGWRKPVVAIRRPGTRLLYLVDGHTRATACAQIGVPLTAYIGTATTATGPWMKTHAKQMASDDDAVELSAQTPALAATPNPWGSPAGPGLWKHKGWKLPNYVEQVSKGIMKSGRAASESEAIQMALGVLRRWASGGGKVTPEVRAASAKAIADYAALKARAHAHANDGDALDLAAPFNAAAHPRVAKGHGNAGQFGSGGTALKAKPAATAGFKPAAPAAPATAKAAAVQVPPPTAPESPAELKRIHALHHQAKQDRALAHKIMAKASALVRVRDGYIAGVLTATGKSTTATAPVSAARSAAAKKAAATVKANGGRKKAAVSSTRTAASTKSANIGKLNGEIRLLRSDAKALIRSANHLDQLASGL